MDIDADMGAFLGIQGQQGAYVATCFLISNIIYSLAHELFRIGL